jgi:hypothetical protein
MRTIFVPLLTLILDRTRLTHRASFAKLRQRQRVLLPTTPVISQYRVAALCLFSSAHTF